MSDYHCSNCKHPVAINTKFCQNCGGKLSIFGPVRRISKRLEERFELKRQQGTHSALGKNGWAFIPLLIITLILCWYTMGLN